MIVYISMLCTYLHVTYDRIEFDFCMKPSRATVEHYGVARQPEHSHAIIACSTEGTKCYTVTMQY